MTWVFLDASGIIALLNKSDSLHVRAKCAFSPFKSPEYRLLTTDLILIEVGNALSDPRFKQSVTTYINSLQTSNKVKIVYTQKTDFDSGLERYSQYADKDWGLVDCISFTTMTQYNCSQAFTHDHHFSQAGFSVLIS